MRPSPMFSLAASIARGEAVGGVQVKVMCLGLEVEVMVFFAATTSSPTSLSDLVLDGGKRYQTSFTKELFSVELRWKRETLLLDAWQNCAFRVRR